MSRLSRAAAGTGPGAPVRIVHLGLGNFFRAHQAWYTHRAPDAADWGIAAFTGRRPDMAHALAPQDGLYTLITKGADGDDAELITSVVAAHASDEHEEFLAYLADPDVAVVTLTVTEAGYRRGKDGRIDLADPAVQADVQALQGDLRAPVTTAPARLVAGAAARRAAGSGALTVLPCDNLPDNGPAVQIVMTSLAEAVDPDLASWISVHVEFASSMVDRITPATTEGDRDIVAEQLGFQDASPVPTEPFSEWVISGEFSAGRPAWDAVGAQLVDDVEPHERRKLWLLNGAHSLLAYAGSIRGHETVADAIGDPPLRELVQQWWAEATRNLGLPIQEVDAYTRALLNRFANPRVKHLLTQIAHDGSQKVPVRGVAVVAAERAAGRSPVGGATMLGAWLLHLRGHGAPVHDATVAAAQRAATTGDLTHGALALLEHLGLGGDDALNALVVSQATSLTD